MRSREFFRAAKHGTGRPNNEVRFFSLNRTAKVKPEYHPKGAEECHSQESVIFAVEHYKSTGKVILHGEVKRILAKRRKSARPGKPEKPI